MKHVIFILTIGLIFSGCESKRSKNIRETQESIKETLYGSEKEQKENLKIFEMVVARVKSELKAPSTAKFPEKDEILKLMNLSRDVAKKTSSDTLSILFHVDAQNSYGAMLRKNVMGTVVKDGDKYIVAEVLMY